MNLRLELETRITAALAAAGASSAPAMVAPSANPAFGDYQANGVMAAAKRAKVNPRELAAKVLEQLAAGGPHDLSDLAQKVEVAGPGFINITVSRELLAREITRAATDPRVDVSPVGQPQTVVVDYSAPNLAKEMHVGHLRSTIIGDAIARTLEFLGHKVIRQNHVGDYGTQFGMLTAYMDLLSREQGEGVAQSNLGDLEAFYRQAKKRFDEDAAFADLARQYVVRLQSGDAEIVERWRKFRAISLTHCEQVYELMNVSLTPADIHGESAYGDDLPAVIADLAKAGLLKESQGAQCVFLEGFANKDGEPLPLIVQKSDEGYLYATTDLAAIRYRVGTLHADRILVAVDARQSLHLQMVMAAARKAGFLPPEVSMEHISFGTMLGEDSKPFKTRTGGTVKLMDLLSETIERAGQVVQAKSPELPAGQKAAIAQAVGIGAVKYADLSMDRTSDYKFSWDKMLNLQGNTAPYMQYAYARIRSIFRKGAGTEGGGAPKSGAILLDEPSELELARKVLRFEEVLLNVAHEAKPNLLTSYLYELAGAFTTFYESCPVLKSDEPVRTSRLTLCDVTARTIQTGLGLLGIETIEQM